MSDPAVSPAWLAARLGEPGLSIIDGTWFMPGDRRDPAAEYREGHIPGASFFDLEEVRDRSSRWPHMLPSEADFQVWARGVGVRDAGKVVVYDAHGLFSAPRLWWMFRAMGARSVFVLDGGLRAWRAEGRPVERGPARALRAGDLRARLDRSWVRAIDDIAENLRTGAAQIVDARSRNRFRGVAAEPRPGLRAGHIPRSVNLPWDEVVDENGRLRTGADLAAKFSRAAVDLDRPVWTTCGSGVTAAILALALARLGREPTPVYDGSWSEWGALEHTPVQSDASP